MWRWLQQIAGLDLMTSITYDDPGLIAAAPEAVLPNV
jgi:hypothetical protein